MRPSRICELSFAVLVAALGIVELGVPAKAEVPPRPTAAQPDAPQAPFTPSSVSLPTVVRPPGGGSTHKLWVPTGVQEEGRANVWVHVPSRFDQGKALRVVVIFRGYKNCIDSYVSRTGLPCAPGRLARTGYDVAAQAERARTSALVIVPELAFDTQSSDAGPIQTAGGLARFLTDVLGALRTTIGRRTVADVERLTLMASSGGYEALMPVMQSGGVPVDEVALFDSLYVDNATFTNFVVGHEDAFLPGAKRPRRFSLLYCKAQKVAGETFGRRLETAVLRTRSPGHKGKAAPPADPALVRFHPWPKLPRLDDLRAPVTIFNVPMEHDEVVATYLWQVLRTSEDAYLGPTGADVVEPAP